MRETYNLVSTHPIGAGAWPVGLIDQDAPIESVPVFGAGSVSMVTAFIGLGRRTKKWIQRPSLVTALSSSGLAVRM